MPKRKPSLAKRLLEEIALPTWPVPPSREARRFLQVARGRCSRIRRAERVPAFVSGDYPGAFAALHHLLAADLPTGNWFCEWGCGLGVVACLAAQLGFEAWGVEIEGALVEGAIELAESFDLPVEIGQGSFLPPGFQVGSQEFAWLDTETPSIYPEWGLDISDFDVIFAYPWPDEEDFVRTLFARHAGPGACLLMQQGEDLHLYRKKN